MPLDQRDYRILQVLLALPVALLLFFLGLEAAIIASTSASVADRVGPFLRSPLTATALLCLAGILVCSRQVRRLRDRA